MDNEKKIPARSDVPKENTWAVEDIFATDQEWKMSCGKVREMAQEAAGFAGKLHDPDSLLAFCRLKEELTGLMRDVSGYASLCHDQDTTAPRGQEMNARARSLWVECEGLLAFEGPEILTIGEEEMSAFYERQPGLLDYRRSIGEIRRRKEHVLAPELEKLLADAGEMADAPQTVYAMLCNADLTFAPALDERGEAHEVTNGSFLSLMEKNDRKLRKNAFESLYAGYEKIQNTAAALLNAQVNQLKFYARNCRYEDTMQASLDATNVPVSVYQNLIRAVHEDIGYLHRYMWLRKKLMGVEELHMYDLYAPMVPDADLEVPFDRAKQDVLDAVSVLGEEYSSVLQQGFQSRWIDIYENRGKRSGAYSSGQRVHPYVLLNYNNSLDSEFTLAHEMGHAMHSWFSNRYQRPVDSRYRIFVAEVASTCNEALLMRHLLGKTTDRRVRASLINYFLEQFRTTLYRQTMFAEFEMQINAASQRGECLTREMLCRMYRELNCFYYGKDVKVDSQIDLEWARIPHFYYNFYVFQYATGFSAAMALSERILSEGEPAVRDYLAFLSGGCSKDPVSLLQGAGVDMRTAEPVRAALSLFASLLDEMEELAQGF